MISSEKSSKLNTSAIGVDIFNCLEGKIPANLSSTNRHPVTMFSMRYRKKNNCKVYNCPTLKITTNICAALFYTLTNTQILRNNQRQNSATHFEEKEIGALGENKQVFQSHSLHSSFQMLSRIHTSAYLISMVVARASSNSIKNHTFLM